jgi:nitrogen fixation protein FixH
MTGKPLTGRKVFLMFAAFFGVVIAINLTLAYQAVSTFPGLEVRNSYVASQSFDKRRAAQLALGWDVAATLTGNQLSLTIKDAEGKPVRLADLTATFGRATHVKEDQTPNFVFDGVAYVAPVRATTGNWNLRMNAVAADGTRFEQRVIVNVKK